MQLESPTPFVLPTADTIGDPAEAAAKLLAEFKKEAEAYVQDKRVDSLAVYIQARFSEAKSFKASIGVDEQIAKARRIVRKEYSPEELQGMSEDEPKIFSGVTDTKIRGGRSWLLDILTNARDKPYTIQPTPIPTLPQAAEDAIVDAIAVELQQQAQQMGQSADGVIEFPADLRERAAKMKKLALDRAHTLATEAAQRIETRIHDRLIEAGWRQAFEAFATDIFMYPSAILKGPYRAPVRKLRWRDGSLQAVAEMGYKISRVSPDRFFPSPNASDVNSQPYQIETVPMSTSELIDAKMIDGVDATAVDKLLASYELGSVGTGFEGPTLETALPSAETAATAVFEVIVYLGRLPAEQLAEMGIVASVGEQPEVEVWVCNDIVLRAVRNPNLLGRRPYYVASMAPTPGSLWGRALPDILDDVQRMCSACLRSLARNLAFSAAPIGEYDAGRLEGETDVGWIQPGRLYKTSSDQMFSPTRSPAMRFTVVPSAAATMLNVHAAFLKLADDVSGIPAYVLGAPQAAGAGRTLGGLSLLMGNAAKGLKAVIGHIDVYVIEPLVTDCYMATMTEGEVPEEDKVDVNIVARGSSGLLQEELAQNRAVETLQLLTPYVDRKMVPPSGVQYMIRRVVAGMGYDPDLVIPDPRIVAQLRAALGGDTLPPEGAPSTQEATPAPPLDGRSAQPADPVSTVAVPAGAT